MAVPPSRAKRTIYCSRACYGRWMSENMTGEKAIRYGQGHTPETLARISATKRANPQSGEKAPNWKGGRYLSRGYVYVKLSSLPEHEQAMFASMATRNGSTYIPEHRLVVARQLGRPLLSSEIVHHHNGTKDDNRPENLELHESNGAHRMKHAEVDAEMFRLRRENAALRALLLRSCVASALLDGSTTSR
jgi:hypothetical protein